MSKPKPKPKPDCRTCGACCCPWQDQSVFCDLEQRDVARLPKGFVNRHVVTDSPFESLVVFFIDQASPYASIETKEVEVKRGPMKGLQVIQCAALRGSLMHQVSCSVYANRPSVCRKAVKPGDKTCLAARRLVQDAIDRLEAAE